jgi:hypothetical protein
MQLNMNADKHRDILLTHMLSTNKVMLSHFVTDAWAVQFCCDIDECTFGAVSNRVFSEPGPFGCDAALVDAASSSSSTRNH